MKARLPKRNMTKPLNIAHRGGAQLWPENTLFAFVSAAKAGYDGAELDVQMTRDEKLVVFHDFRLKPELCRFSDGRWVNRRNLAALPLIRDLTFANSGYDVGRPNPDRSTRSSIRMSRPRRRAHAHLARSHRGGAGGQTRFSAFRRDQDKPRRSRFVRSPRSGGRSRPCRLRRAEFLEHAVLVGFDWRGLIHASGWSRLCAAGSARSEGRVSCGCHQGRLEAMAGSVP
jgi:glycerophosphoryl diester phosphodiesterase